VLVTTITVSIARTEVKYHDVGSSFRVFYFSTGRGSWGRISPGDRTTGGEIMALQGRSLRAT